jgi:hypothetical protein
MNIFTRLVGRVKLDDYVYPWNVQTTSCNVRAHEDPAFSITELKKSGSTFLLFLLAMQTENGEVDVIEKIGIKFHRIAAA